MGLCMPEKYVDAALNKTKYTHQCDKVEVVANLNGIVSHHQDLEVIRLPVGHDPGSEVEDEA